MPYDGVVVEETPRPLVIPIAGGEGWETEGDVEVGRDHP